MSDGPAIYLPVGRMYPTPQSRASSAILANESHIGDLTAALGGRTAKPRKPIVIWAPDGRQQIVLIGAGVTEAAELEDMAHRAFAEAREEMAKNGGKAFDADTAREKRGLPRREEAGAAMAEALWDRVQRHKANPVTDPAPPPAHNPRPGNGTIFAQPQSTDWKGKA